jgi:hypothetical protein
VFHVLWLGHMYMGSKDLPMHSSQSPVYGEILARCTRAAYHQYMLASDDVSFIFIVAKHDKFHFLFFEPLFMQCLTSNLSRRRCNTSYALERGFPWLWNDHLFRTRCRCAHRRKILLAPTTQAPDNSVSNHLLQLSCYTPK